MALIAKQKYDQQKIDKLAEYLKIYYQKGQPIDYEIIVDGLKAVRRTSDPEMFYIYESFITGDTNSIEILFYTGTSNNNDKHIFTFNEDPKEQSLNGTEVNQLVQEQVARERREWTYKQLEKENEELRREVKDLEEDIEKLEKEIEAFTNNKSPLQGILGEFGSSFLESFIRRNPNVIASLPGGEALAGLIDQDNKRKEHEGDTYQNTQETEVTFKPKGHNTPSSISDDDKAAIEFVNQLKAQFTKDEFDNVLLILQTLADDKSKIDLILNHVNIKRNSHEQAQF